MNQGSNKRAKQALLLLNNLLALLQLRQEENWSRGIQAAIDELTVSTGQTPPSNFKNARSIYRTMTAGGRGFSEYCVWLDDANRRRQCNQTLDILRQKLREVSDKFYSAPK